MSAPDPIPLWLFLLLVGVPAAILLVRFLR
jgi:hypothetical protein